MKNRLLKLATVCLSTLISQPSIGSAQGTGFTYQGRLTDGVSPANGNYDLRFTMHDLANGGSVVAGPMTNNAVGVTNGFFTVTLDFGASGFTGADRWLEIGVRTNGGGAFSTLAPRQPLSPTPYAISAANLMSPASGPIEIKVNGQRALRLEPNSSQAPNVIGGASANLVDAGVVGATIGGGGANNFGGGALTNRVAGDFGTISGGAQNTIQPNSSLGTIGGGYLNTIASGADNATIGGGTQNQVDADADYALISGGFLNRIETGIVQGTVGGGRLNRIRNGANNSTISGGNENAIRSLEGTIAGGAQNTIELNARSSSIGGGINNIVLAEFGSIGGGQGNAIQPFVGQATISGGLSNRIDGDGFGAAIGGGYKNTSSGLYATVSGGSENINSGDHATLAGGFANTNRGEFATVSGGSENIATNQAATVGGGQRNRSFGLGATVGGGWDNLGSGGFTVVSGGSGNLCSGGHATIGGGFQNESTGDYSIVAGGYGNDSSGYIATVAGGIFNDASGDYSFAAGTRARAVHEGAFVWADSSPGDFNSQGSDTFNIRASGGVRLNTDTSIHFGNQARQMLNLWSTQYGIGVQSGTTYFRTSSRFSWFSGGQHADPQNDPGTGGSVLMTLNSGGLTVNGTFVSASDRNAKENFQPVNPRDVLDKLAVLPMSEWSYKADDERTRHIGPMAQDFHAAFGVGPDNKHIATVDADGVALAAIQGLNQKLTEELNRRDGEIAELKRRSAENAELKAELDKLRQMVDKLANTKD